MDQIGSSTPRQDITRQPSVSLDLSKTKKILDASMELVIGLGMTTFELAPEPVQKIAETIFGMVQATAKGHLLEECNEGVKRLREKGQLINVRASDIAYDAVTELFDFIGDVKTSDKERFEAAKKLFLYGLLTTVKEIDRVHAKQFLKITKQLQGEDILILKACYELSKTYNHSTGNYPTDADGWAIGVANKSGLKFKGLVLSRENNLIEHSLIGKRTHSDQSGIAFSDKARLSDWGVGYCEFLERADIALEDLL